MTRRFLSLLLVGVLGLGMGLAEAAAPPRSADDCESIVYLGERGPVLVRLHLRLHGRPHRALWNRLIDDLFAYADRDRDGVLSPAEAKRLPPVAALASGPFFALTGGSAKAAKPGKMTRADVAEYYRKARLSAFQLSYQDRGNGIFSVGGNQPISPDQVNARLFSLLDADGDGVLSRRELEAAPAVLGKLDADEDEMLTPQELLGKGGRTSADDDSYGVAFGQTGNAKEVEKPLHLVSGASDPGLARRLLKVYARKGAKTLDAKAPGMTKGLFARLDRNRDGVLDAEELSRYAAVAEADVEITVRLSAYMPATPFATKMAPPAPKEPAKKTEKKEPAKKTEKSDRPAPTESATQKDEAVPAEEVPKAVTESTVDRVAQKISGAWNNLFKSKPDTRPAIELHRARRPLPAGVKVTSQDQVVSLTLGTTTITLQAGVSPQNGLYGFDATSQYRTLFQMADTDGNGYVDKKEADSNVFFRGTFEAMDTDGDGKLYEKEMLGYLKAMDRLRDQTAKSCLTLTARDVGKSLFARVDANDDGRLSVRELRQLASALLKLDANGDGQLSPSEVPRTYAGTFASGPAGGLESFGAFAISAAARVKSPVPAKGPLWFRKMDRNRDGDVSRKEWLGSDEDFKAIDIDGDGLISLDEALAYDRTKRPAKK